MIKQKTLALARAFGLLTLLGIKSSSYIGSSQKSLPVISYEEKKDQYTEVALENQYELEFPMEAEINKEIKKMEELSQPKIKEKITPKPVIMPRHPVSKPIEQKSKTIWPWENLPENPVYFHNNRTFQIAKPTPEMIAIIEFAANQYGAKNDILLRKLLLAIPQVEMPTRMFDPKSYIFNDQTKELEFADYKKLKTADQFGSLGFYQIRHGNWMEKSCVRTQKNCNLFVIKDNTLAGAAGITGSALWGRVDENPYLNPEDKQYIIYRVHYTKAERTQLLNEISQKYSSQEAKDSIKSLDPAVTPLSFDDIANIALHFHGSALKTYPSYLTNIGKDKEKETYTGFLREYVQCISDQSCIAKYQKT